LSLFTGDNVYFGAGADGADGG